MQHNSYGPSQPSKALSDKAKDQPSTEFSDTVKEEAGKDFLRIPRGCARRNKRSSTRARGHGGARNFKNRVSTALKQEHAEGILRAIAVAELRGMPLNRFWTVNYEWAGIDDCDGTAFIGKLLELCHKYARARGGVFAAVWVREIGSKNGAHVHIALHFPFGWKLSGHLIRKWIKQAGGQYSRKVSKMDAIGGSLICATTNPILYWANMETVASYMVKGSAGSVANELGLSLRKWGGRVIGKRWGRTQNLG
ncbi:hypothetical protein [Erythrobacter sp. JK5]|uniref:hypothetical protein n=1 Tax=Erythrobacter sp. JK5 TaxID=2829500 RepID=UPI001BABDA5A|nr:hypothetical protein [Erythrobacter sp. JK5]QUL38138.1 hypothetical protein KDC96_01565 [Erythrobacter sp. JK5]